MRFCFTNHNLTYECSLNCFDYNHILINIINQHCFCFLFSFSLLYFLILTRRCHYKNRLILEALYNMPLSPSDKRWRFYWQKIDPICLQLLNHTPSTLWNVYKWKRHFTVTLDSIMAFLKVSNISPTLKVKYFQLYPFPFERLHKCMLLLKSKHFE